jgi:tetracycline resistance efflux pump
MEDYGIYCLVPPFVVILVAILLRRSFEALLVGCAVGFAMISFHTNKGSWLERLMPFPGDFVNGLKTTLQSADMVWVILVCGLYGSLIHLIIQSGGAMAFGTYMLRYIKTRKSAMLVTWATGLLIFLDDYMSALAVGVTMRKITDQYRISREMLAYLVNTMAAPVCIVVPMTTWSIYCGGLIQGEFKSISQIDVDPVMGFIYTIPYMFYGWVSIAIALLVASGLFPLIGKLRIAENRVKNGGSLLPEGSVASEVDQNTEIYKNAKPYYFFAPIFALIIFTLFFKEALLGAMSGLIFTIFFYWIMRVNTYGDLSDGVFEGFKSMIVALGILTMSYVLKMVGDKMGLTQYVITSVKPILTKEVLAAVVFVALATIAYLTSSSWGMYAVALPIVIPLAQSLGANVWMSIAAVISAGAFGSNASFYSDVTVLASSSTQCNNLEHSFSQLPYALISLSVSACLFLGFGYFG